MGDPAFTAVKLQSSDLAASEAFFRDLFGFAVKHRYGGGPGDPFEEIVMTLRGGDGMMLKFIRHADLPVAAAGATIQFVLDDIESTIARAKRVGATVRSAPTDYPEAGVRMAVITTDQGLDLELVTPL